MQMQPVIGAQGVIHVVERVGAKLQSVAIEGLRSEFTRNTSQIVSSVGLLSAAGCQNGHAIVAPQYICLFNTWITFAANDVALAMPRRAKAGMKVDQSNMICISRMCV